MKRSGDKVRLDVIRDGKRRSVTAAAGRARGAASRSAAEEIHPGLAGAELAELRRHRRQLRRPGRAWSTAVEPESPAAARGLRANDIIVAVNRVRVRTVKEFQEVARPAEPADPVGPAR